MIVAGADFELLRMNHIRVGDASCKSTSDCMHLISYLPDALTDSMLPFMQFYEESCLIRQKFVMGDDQTVQVCASPALL